MDMPTNSSRIGSNTGITRFARELQAILYLQTGVLYAMLSVGMEYQGLLIIRAIDAVPPCTDLLARSSALVEAFHSSGRAGQSIYVTRALRATALWLSAYFPRPTCAGWASPVGLKRSARASACCSVKCVRHKPLSSCLKRSREQRPTQPDPGCLLPAQSPPVDGYK